MPIDEHSIITMFESTFKNEFTRGFIALISSDGLALYVIGNNEKTAEYEAISSILLSNLISTQRKIDNIESDLGNFIEIALESENYVISCMELIDGFYLSLKVQKKFYKKVNEAIGTFRKLLSAVINLQDLT